MSETDVESIEVDLEKLAAVTGGFERPEQLAARLKVIPELTCVRNAARPRETLRQQRILALSGVLYEVIQRIQSPTTRQAAEIYFFQDKTDGLDQALLGERRTAIEERLGATHGSFRRGEEQRIRAIVAGELKRFEVDTQHHGPVPPPIADDELTQDTASRQAAAQVITNVLTRHFDSESDTYPLASLLLADRPVYRHVLVDLALRDSEQDDLYIYDLSLTFTADLDEYVVGIVSNPALCDLLLTACPGVTDIYSCSSDKGRHTLAEQLEQSVDAITRLRQTANGRTAMEGLRLEPVEGDEKAKYLGDLGDSHVEDVSLLRAKLRNREPGSTRLRVHQIAELEKSDHFCYWVADRPIFVNRISVDCHAFTASDSQRDNKVTVQPFMMAAVTDGALSKKSPITLELENWLVRGQGIAVIW